MTRFILAFSSFFRLLFGGKLHPKAVDYLPESAKPALPEPKKDAPAKKVETRKSEDKPKKRKGPSEDLSQAQRDGALTLVGLLQREGRLVDFLRESLDDHGDADIGAAVRDIHRGCKKVLEGHFEIEAVMPGEEDDSISVPKGFDPAEVKLIGEVSGDPPFKGVLRHHGWRATKVKLPELSAGVDRNVLAPAEVEVQS
jgi:hypothetical protein